VKTFLSGLNPKRNLYLRVFLLGLITTAAFFLPFVIYNKGIFLFYGDYNVQQIPFYQNCHQLVRDGIFGWHFGTDLGVNFVGSYSFYLLGSPFFWLTIPFPNAWVPYLMAPLFCLKFATAATTGFALIKRFVKNPEYAVIGGLLYSFSGFAVYNIFFNHFNDVIALFPLLLIALEETVANQKCRGIFALTVCLMVTVNYFFFVGQVMFTIIYFFLRLPCLDFQLNLKKFGILFFEAVLGLMLGMLLLLPSIEAIADNPRLEYAYTGWNMLFYTQNQRIPAIIECFFFPPDLPARPNFLPNGEAKWASLGGWLPMVGMCGVLAFMQSKKGHWIRRIIAISAVMACVPILNSVFFLFNSSYYARWFYMPVLMMSIATVIMLEEAVASEEGRKRFMSGLRWSLFITLAFAIPIGLIEGDRYDETLPLFDWNITNTRFWSLGLAPFPERFWAYVLIAVISIVLTALLIRFLRNHKRFTAIFTTCVLTITVIYSALYIGTGKQHSYRDEDILSYAIGGSENLDLPEDENFYRIDLYDPMDNMAMFWKIPTIQAFHSIVPAGVMEFYNSVGVERTVGSRPDPELLALRYLLSCKYYFIFENSNNENAPILEGFSFFDTQNNHRIYQNDHFIPVGFTYDTYVTEGQFEAVSEDNRSRLLLKGILLTEEQIAEYGRLMEPHSDDIWVDYSDAATVEDADARREEASSSYVAGKNSFTSVITLEKENLIFYSIPYDEGWSATVNGEPVQIEKVNKGFMAVKGEAGENTVVFTYTTPGLATGALVSLVSLIVLIGYMVICWIWNRKHPQPVLILERVEEDAEQTALPNYFDRDEEDFGEEIPQKEPEDPIS